MAEGDQGGAGQLLAVQLGGAGGDGADVNLGAKEDSEEGNAVFFRCFKNYNRNKCKIFI